jgi:cobalt/nickel transport system permease protein
MTLPIAFPVRLGAPLSRVDPRWKLAALVPAGLVCGALRTIGPASVALALALAVAALARVPLRWYVSRIGTLILLLAVFLAFLPLADHGSEARWQLGLFSISPAGSMLAAVLLLKATALMTLLVAAATTAAVSVQFKALHALRVPGLAVQLLALTIRYLAVLLDEFARIRIALRVRGYRQRATLRSMRIVANVWGMLLLRASERADRVSHALQCRGYDGRFRALAEFKTRYLDVVFWAVVSGVALGLLVWDFMER